MIPTSGLVGGTIGGGGVPTLPGAAGACDAQASVNDCTYRLGFMPYGDIGPSSWVTPNELLQFGDDAAKLLSRITSLFLTYDNSTNVVAGTPQYDLPAAHVFTVTAWLVSPAGAVQQLRLTTVGQLFALDAAWTATQGNPTRLSMDQGAVGIGTLYPNPTADATLALVFQAFPTIAPGQTTLPISVVLQDMITYWMLKGARGFESDNRMDDMAKHFSDRFDLYTAVAQHLWGSGA